VKRPKYLSLIFILPILLFLLYQCRIQIIKDGFQDARSEIHKIYSKMWNISFEIRLYSEFNFKRIKIDV